MQDLSLDSGNKPMGLKWGRGNGTQRLTRELFQHTCSPFPRESDESTKLTLTLTPQQITKWSSLPSFSGRYQQSNGEKLNSRSPDPGQSTVHSTTVEMEQTRNSHRGPDRSSNWLSQIQETIRKCRTTDRVLIQSQNKRGMTHCKKAMKWQGCSRTRVMR